VVQPPFLLQRHLLIDPGPDPQRLNESTLDPVGPLGGDKGEKFLCDLNEMQDLERDTGKENPDR
jgi:hypothetical protein